MPPLAAFVLACLILPFFATAPFFFPVISRGRPIGVSLTFDDGPDPHSTPLLLDLLAKHEVRATFFVTGERARLYPQLLTAMVNSGHTLGNHSYSHDNWIMFRRPATILGEIQATQQAIGQCGLVPTLFRPPVGILTPCYAEALAASGLAAATFSRRARDMGNRRVHGMADRILRRLRAGDIVLLHDAPPKGTASLEHWLAEVGRIIGGCAARDLAILPLEQLINRPVLRLAHESAR